MPSWCRGYRAIHSVTGQKKTQQLCPQIDLLLSLSEAGGWTKQTRVSTSIPESPARHRAPTVALSPPTAGPGAAPSDRPKRPARAALTRPAGCANCCAHRNNCPPPKCEKHETREKHVNPGFRDPCRHECAALRPRLLPPRLLQLLLQLRRLYVLLRSPLRPLRRLSKQLQ